MEGVGKRKREGKVPREILIELFINRLQNTLVRYDCLLN